MASLTCLEPPQECCKETHWLTFFSSYYSTGCSGQVFPPTTTASSSVGAPALATRKSDLLAYAVDLVLLASSSEEAQRLVNGLAKAAANIGFRINTKKTEVFTIPSNLPVSLRMPASEASAANPLPSCQSFRFLGGQIPDIKEDLRHSRSLAWAAFRFVRSMLQNDCLSDQFRGKLFQALMESVLLYNAETWTMTNNFEKQVYAAHAKLLRETFRLHHLHNPASNKEVYERARLHPPSVTLRRRRLKLIGHVFRSKRLPPRTPPRHSPALAPGSLRRGQGRTV